jgi:hypothetical protein
MCGQARRRRDLARRVLRRPGSGALNGDQLLKQKSLTLIVSSDGFSKITKVGLWRVPSPAPISSLGGTLC